jgi:hypothetical protein
MNVNVENEEVKLLLLMSNVLLISVVKQVYGEIGEPDCKLIDPFQINQSSLELYPWMSDVSSQNIIMISSDKILTIMEPNDNLLKKYSEVHTVQTPNNKE